MQLSIFFPITDVSQLGHCKIRTNADLVKDGIKNDSVYTA